MEKVVSIDERRRKAPVKKQIKYKPTFDYFMIVVLVLLVCVGLVMVYSASYYTAEIREDSPQYYFVKQIICVAIGTLLMLATMFFDYHSYSRLPWEKHKWMAGIKNVKLYWVILIFALACLLLVFVPGIGMSVNGSRRWINVGISIQPSEIMKMALIIFFASSIGRDPRRLKQFGKGLLPYLLLLACVCVPIYLQPNYSAIICIGMLVFVLLFLGGARLNHLGIVIAVAVVALAILVVREGYRVERLEALKDPLSEWQTQQSLYSFGAGGLFGRGLGNSMQKMLYLPMGESDFIFSVIGEELGFVGAVGVLALFGLLIWRGVIAAMRAPDLTGLLMASGVVAILVIQVVINIGVTVGLIPPTGVVLPFVSYGGSGVIMFMCMVGLLLNVSRQSVQVTPVGERGEIPDTPNPLEEGKGKRRRR